MFLDTMRCILLAAGFGTRLRPLTNNCPKPLIKVANKSILCHITDKLTEYQGNDLHDISVVGNAIGNRQLQDWKKFKDSQGFKFPITVLNDNTTTNENRLGAIGDIQFTIDSQNIDDDLLIIAGDNLFEFSINDFLNFFKNKNATTVAFRNIENKSKLQQLGVGITQANGTKLIGFQEKPDEPKSTLASTLCYLIKKEDLRLIKPLLEKGYIDNAGELIKHLATNSEVHAYIFNESWFDIGTLDAHTEAQEYYSSK
jgi:glucose-1-phosphate thymidylyltransferase